MVVGNSSGHCDWLAAVVAKKEEEQGQLKQTKVMKKKKLQLCQQQ